MEPLYGPGRVPQLARVLGADRSGVVPQRPDPLDARERQACLPVLARGAVVGCVELNENMVGLITASEQAFLDQLRNTLGIAALAACLLGRSGRAAASTRTG